MKKEDLDALAGLYEGVYSPTGIGEYLTEGPYDAANIIRAQQAQQGRDSFKNVGGYAGLSRAAAAAGDTAGARRYMQKSQEIGDKNKAAAAAAAASNNANREQRRQQDIEAYRKAFGKPATTPAAKPTLTDAEFDKKYGTNDPKNNLARPENNKPRVIPAATSPAGTTPPAARPTAARPTAAPKPFVKQTGDKAKDEATWKKANPTLANKPKTPNPLMKNMPGQNKAELDQLRGNAAINSISQSPSAKNILSGTAKSSTANQIGKASLDRSAAATEAKPASNVFSRSKETVKKMTSTPNPANQNISSGYEWPSAKTIKDIADAYASIYEGKKKDQDEDGDTDFADVRIARMIASGMSKAEAIAAVKNKSYNEEGEIAKEDFEFWVDSLVEEGYDLSNYTWDDMYEIYLDEATRMRKELGKEGEIAIRKELAARSKAYKRSGSVDKTIAAAERGADRPYIKYKPNESDEDRREREEEQSKTLRGLAASRRGSVRDKPRAGLRGYAAKVEGGDKDLQSARQGAMSAGTLTPAEKKKLGEVYEIVASYLLENNFAATLNDANVIIENMSEVWLSQILESVE
jgi:hypothetical protein